MLDTELISGLFGISFQEDFQKKPGGYSISSGGLAAHLPLTSVKKSKSRQIHDFPESEALFDFDKLELPLYLRARERGDRFHPLGMSQKPNGRLFMM